MDAPQKIPAFSKALLAGALTGLAATVANMVYDVAFRGITQYYPAEEFNFFSITLASIIVSMLVGMLFYVFIKNFGKTAFFIALSIIIIACVCITALVHADKTEAAFFGNHGLIAGFVIISGILSLTLLPYLFNHPKIFI